MNWCVCVLIKLCVQKQVVGQIWPVGCSLSTPDLSALQFILLKAQNRFAGNFSYFELGNQYQKQVTGQRHMSSLFQSQDSNLGLPESKVLTLSTI